jgi:3-dehydroquinate synthase
MPVSHTLKLPNYNIQIGALGPHLAEWLAGREYAGYAVLCDTHTAEHCLPRFQAVFPAYAERVITVPAGELHKNLATCQQIWQALFAAGAGRRWCLFNLGGGVIGDMGGFCAATFKRGIDFIQVPTTLLSQVDASVGGKLGIDFNHLKNSIGLFRDPAAVWIDPAFLTTLSDRELRSGFAEVIKHALIADQAQWARLRAVTDIRALDLGTLIRDSVAVKQKIVAADPFERGLRKALNFGHTVGHAIESYFLETADPLLHGEAIAYGMVIEGWLSQQLCGLPIDAYKAVRDLILRLYGHRAIPEAAFAELIASMQQDKKNESAAINFSFLPALGQVEVNRTANTDQIHSAILHWNQGA